MKSILIPVVLLIVSGNTFADKANPEPGEVLEKRYSYGKPLKNYEIKYKSPKEARADISTKNGIKRFEAGDIEGFADISTANLWVFTLKHNPAHPAVMKLRAFESGKNIQMKTSVKCGASKVECDKFVSYQNLLSRSVVSTYKAHIESKSPNKAIKKDN